MSGNTSDGILRLETTPQAFLGGLGGHHWAAFVSVGDGRSEIWAGAQMGAVMISRLPESAAYQRALHKSLGTNVIVADYTDPRLMAMFTEV